MKIAVDAMGGDKAPEVIVKGAEKFAKEFTDTDITLYGDQESIQKYLSENLENIHIVHTSEVITGEDDPVRAVRRKKDSSMVRAAYDVKNGEQYGLFSAGNTGALLSAGTLIVGRIPGVIRPALMSSLPNFKNSDHPTVFLDLGANSDTKPEAINQFGVLGSVFAKTLYDLDQPKVALLNNGTEEGKGNQTTIKAYELLTENSEINFVGNVEARELLQSTVDVVVTDGFVGNAVLKAIEGTALTLGSVLKDAILSSGFKGKLGGLLLKGSLKELKQQADYSKLGGAILVGVNAPVMKTHGSANEQAVYETLKQMRMLLNSEVISDLNDYFERI